MSFTLTARQLTIADFGCFGLIQSTLGIFAVFAGAGLGVTATRFVAEYRVSDPSRAGEILGVIRTLALCATGCAVLLILLFASRIASLLDPDVAHYAGVWKLSSIHFAAQTWRGLQDATLMGLERFKDCALIKLVEGLASVVLLPALAHFYELRGAIVGQVLLGAIVLSFAARWIDGLKRSAGMKVGWRSKSKDWRTVCSFSVPTLLSSIIGAPVLWMGIGVLTLQPDGLRQVALYNAAYQWHGPLVLIPMALCSASLPALVTMWTSRQRREFYQSFWALICVTALIGFASALMLIGFGDQVMSSYGPDYVEGRFALILLLLAAPAHGVANISAAALQSMAQAWLVTMTSLLWALIFVVLTLLFVPKLGAGGLALAFMISYLVLALVRILTVRSRTLLPATFGS